MALKIDAKFERKLTKAFKNDIKNLENFQWLKNSDLNLKSKMTKYIKINQIKIQNNQSNAMQYGANTLFFLGNNKSFSNALQNRCS